MDYILSHLEGIKDRLTNTDSVTWRASVMLGWQKLDQYSTKTDLNPANIAAVFLHPCFKKAWFVKHWHEDDVDDALLTTTTLYRSAQTKYSHLVPPRTSPRRELNGIDAHNAIQRDAVEPDGLGRYLHASQAPQGTDSLQWWRDNEHLYPVLKHLAFTVLAAPASTAADGRLFSIAGNVVNEQRPHTEQELA